MHYLATSLIASLCWGTFPLLDRYASYYLNGVTMASVRGLFIGIISIIILGISLVSKKNDFKIGYKKGGNKLVAVLALSTIIAFGIGHMCFYTALSDANSSLIQIFLITHCLPLIILSVLSVFVYNDKLCWQMVLGIVMAITGISLTVMYNPNHSS